jgi:hypothetical protein
VPEHPPCTPLDCWQPSAFTSQSWCMSHGAAIKTIVIFRSAASTVWEIRVEIVIGPTPPGTARRIASAQRARWAAQKPGAKKTAKWVATNSRRGPEGRGCALTVLQTPPAQTGEAIVNGGAVQILRSAKYFGSPLGKYDRNLSRRYRFQSIR